MRRQILVVLMMTGLFSCAEYQDILLDILNREETIADTEGEKWQLVSMSGRLPNSETTGDDMEWQEFYLLREDETFIKSREQDGITREAGGTYQWTQLSDGEYLILKYFEDNDLIGNCTGDSKEYLFRQSETQLTGTWLACDGPGLVYERVD